MFHTIVLVAVSVAHCLNHCCDDAENIVQCVENYVRVVGFSI